MKKVIVRGGRIFMRDGKVATGKRCCPPPCLGNWNIHVSSGYAFSAVYNALLEDWECSASKPTALNKYFSGRKRTASRQTRATCFDYPATWSSFWSECDPTASVAKAIVKVGGKTMLEHTSSGLSLSGLDRLTWDNRVQSARIVQCDQVDLPDWTFGTASAHSSASESGNDPMCPPFYAASAGSYIEIGASKPGKTYINDGATEVTNEEMSGTQYVSLDARLYSWKSVEIEIVAPAGSGGVAFVSMYDNSIPVRVSSDQGGSDIEIIQGSGGFSFSRYQTLGWGYMQPCNSYEVKRRRSLTRHYLKIEPILN